MSTEFCCSHEPVVLQSAALAVLAPGQDLSEARLLWSGSTPGENLPDTAGRVLAAETGAARFSLIPIGVFRTEDPEGEAWGMLYLARIHSFRSNARLKKGPAEPPPGIWASLPVRQQFLDKIRGTGLASACSGAAGQNKFFDFSVQARTASITALR